MSATLEQVVKDAMELPQHQKLALAEFLIGSADSTIDLDAKSSWDSEIRDRIASIEEGRVTGVSYAEVMSGADRLLTP